MGSKQRVPKPLSKLEDPGQTEHDQAAERGQARDRSLRTGDWNPQVVQGRCAPDLGAAVDVSTKRTLRFGGL